ncbi:uncharacterized protein LOC121813637 [Haplochromis burtoni]|uniref:uncharacterized protein LOC121813637 n=1 Tax=Haplochromis burtoni TaxID=8153 RepID=UPI001C2D6E71|nr:uncharacterized protein LOC121813637 [Haplochromis burtoni]
MASVDTAVITPRTIRVEGSNPSSLPDDLAFYTRFETDNIIQLEESRSSLKPGSSALTFRTEDVVRALRRTRERSSPGPDNISSRVVRHCAGQLGSVFWTLFQHLIDSHTVPQLWKHSTVIPIPKRNNPKSLNDLRPVALTSLVMKAMEKIIKQHIVRATDPLMDPLQFAYRARRGVDDAKIFILDSIHKHLELPDSLCQTSYKYLGTIFDNLLKFSANTEENLKRCHQQLYVLGKLNSFGVSTPIMMTFPMPSWKAS